jgi:hypothetical protein
VVASPAIELLKPAGGDAGELAAQFDDNAMAQRPLGGRPKIAGHNSVGDANEVGLSNDAADGRQVGRL